MSIGIGNLYNLIAILSAALSVVAMILIAIASLVRGGSAAAVHNFHRLIAWFFRNRMYQ